MKTVKISDRHFVKLKSLAAHYYVVEGEKPMELSKVVQKMIDEEYGDYSPTEYQTTGFDRQ